MPRLWKHILITCTTIGVISSALLVTMGRSTTLEIAQAVDLPEVEVVQVTQQDVPLSSEWIGTLEGMVNATIKAQVAGWAERWAGARTTSMLLPIADAQFLIGEVERRHQRHSVPFGIEPPHVQEPEIWTAPTTRPQDPGPDSERFDIVQRELRHASAIPSFSTLRPFRII